MFIIVLFLILGTALVWIGSEWLESSSVIISDHYNVPDVVRGSVITAFGSSFPELSSVVIATLIHGELELGIGIVLGSAIFNVVVIPGLSGVSASGMDLDEKIVSKEVGIYSIVVIFTGLFFIFSNYLTNNAIDIQGETVLNPYLGIVLILGYVVYVWYQKRLTESRETIKQNTSNLRKEWAKILISLILIGVGVEALVRAVIDLGALLNTPSFFWGLIIVAGSSSLPDAFVSIKQADNEYHSASITNVMGSNIFDLLVVLSVGVILSGGVSISLSSVIPLLIALVVASLIVWIMIRDDGYISVQESYGLLLVYGIFVSWILLEAFGIVGLINNSAF